MATDNKAAAQPGEGGKLTITDIARLAGVSKKTVSRVINHSGLVKQETRDRILKIVAEHDYRPDPQARALALRRSHLIAFVSNQPNPQYRVSMQSGILDAVNGTPYEVLISSCDRSSPTLYDDIEEQLNVLRQFWSAVKEVFPDAWGELPRKSRLMHGAGVISMGFLMDTIADRHRRKRELTAKLFAKDLEPLRDVCRWTEGHWEFGEDNTLKWNEVQNVPRHIQMLSNYLLIQYREKVWQPQRRK